MHTFKSIHNGDIPLQDVEKEQIELKKDLGRIKHGDPKNKSQQQEETINNISQEKKLFKYLIIMLRTCLQIFMIQNKEHDLKY